MASEVRKVLDSYSFFEIPLWLTRLDAAECTDAAKREEPVQELRQKVAELVKEWHDWTATCDSIDSCKYVLQFANMLNAIIATKADPVENRQATASGPVMHESVWHGPYNVPPHGEIQLDDHIRAIAAEVVRDAMPDVLDGLAETHKERGWYGMADGIKRYADKLRKERGA